MFNINDYHYDMAKSHAKHINILQAQAKRKYQK